MKILAQYQETLDRLNDNYIGRKQNGMPGLPVYANYLNEREWMRIKREELKQPPPWTEDEILANFRFTNIHREDDKVSRQLLGHMDLTAPLPIILFNAVLFRSFNSVVGFEACGGWTTEWDRDATLVRANEAYENGASMFGNAYLITNSLTKGAPKHVYFINLMEDIWNDRETLVELIQSCNSLQETMQLFTGYPGYAEFLGYELALDMEMVGILINPKDKHTWANPGPGARRGLNYVHGRDKNYKQPTSDFLDEMKVLYEEAEYFLEPHIDLDHFDMRCIENGLCETGKYYSVLQTGRAKRRYLHV